MKDRISLADEMYALATAVSPGKKRWFGRKFKVLEPQEREEIVKILEGRGIDLSGLNVGDIKKKKHKVREMVMWTDEEWDRLADAIWRARKNDPTKTLISLLKKVMGILPTNRHRTINSTNEIKQLTKRITKLDEESITARTALEEAKVELELAREELKAKEDKLEKVPTKEEILNSLPDDEVRTHFGERLKEIIDPESLISSFEPAELLDHVPISQTIGRVFEFMLNKWEEDRLYQRELLESIKKLAERNMEDSSELKKKQKMPMPNPKVAVKPSLPRVTVLGLLPKQQNQIDNRFKDRAIMNFVDKNRGDNAIPDGQDVIALAANFSSHSMQDQAKSKLGSGTKLIIHHGGVAQLIKKIDEAIN